MADSLPVFVSTTAFGSDVDRAIDAAREHSLSLEFGSAIPHSSSLTRRYRSLDVPRLPHNYFPAPERSFVLNLASSNGQIREHSIKHCIQGIDLAAESDAPFYAAHAGFCIDPDPEHLGCQWSLESPYDIKQSYRTFHSSVDRLADHADRRNVDFLIENNVVTTANVDDDGNTPLLCTHPEEIEQFFQDVDRSHVGLLLDTGHLKVTAQTFKFDLHEATERLKQYVGGIHHSDNDGQADTNSPIGEDYWFLRHLPDVRGTPQVLEVKDQSTDSILRQIDLLKQYCDS